MRYRGVKGADEAVIGLMIPSMPFYSVLCYNMRVLWKEYPRRRPHVKNRTGMPVELTNEIMGVGITVRAAMNEMDQIEARHKNVERVCGQVPITTRLGYVTGRDRMLKRTMDIFGGLVGSVVTLLLAAALSPMICVASSGPIFFKQTRKGAM